MAGPRVQIRAAYFEKSHRIKIKALLERFAHVDIDNFNTFEFNFKKGITLGIKLDETSGSFTMDFAKTNEETNTETQDIAEKIGDKPAMFVNIFAASNQADDHLLLAKFAYELTKIVGGYINLNGAIVPPLVKSHRGDFVHHTHSNYRNYVNLMLGGVHEIVGKIAADNTFYHICDADWLDNWMKHKDFHMNK